VNRSHWGTLQGSYRGVTRRESEQQGRAAGSGGECREAEGRGREEEEAYGVGAGRGRRASEDGWAGRGPGRGTEDGEIPDDVGSGGREGSGE